MLRLAPEWEEGGGGGEDAEAGVRWFEGLEGEGRGWEVGVAIFVGGDGGGCR